MSTVLEHIGSSGNKSIMTCEFKTFSMRDSVSSIQYPAPSIQRPVAGFTLMEILLAILILGLVVTTILASFNAVFSTTETLDSSSKYYNMAKTCLNRMTIDLETLFVNQPPLYKAPDFDDPPDLYRIFGSQTNIGGTSFANLRFASHGHVPFENSTREGIAEIIYYVIVKNDGQFVLKRADNLYPYPTFEEKASDPVLCENVKSLAFKYYDQEGTEADEWDSDTDEYQYATPTTIKIQLELGNETESYPFETTVRLPVYRGKTG